MGQAYVKKTRKKPFSSLRATSPGGSIGGSFVAPTPPRAPPPQRACSQLGFLVLLTRALIILDEKLE